MTLLRPHGFRGCLWPVGGRMGFRWCGAEVGDPAVDEYCTEHEAAAEVVRRRLKVADPEPAPDELLERHAAAWAEAT